MERNGSPFPHPPARSLRVGLLGCGTVGTEVARVLYAGTPGLEPVRIAVRDLDKPRHPELSGAAFTGDALAVVKDPDVDIVVELIGGLEPAYSLLRQALAEGKHVVTANKVLLARYGEALGAAADERGRALLFEGAVCGAVPIVRTLRSLSPADHVRSLRGVLNGTTNFILGAIERGDSFADAVENAQAAGFAEADPGDDLEGVDAACKLSLLCSLAFGETLPLERIAYRGIKELPEEEVRAARSQGLSYKLLATAERTVPGPPTARVEPVALKDSDPLARLDGVSNGVVVEASLSGTLSLYGAGAGGPATAAAVLADLDDIATTHPVVPGTDAGITTGRRSI